MRTNKQKLMRPCGLALLGLLAVVKPTTTVCGRDPADHVSSVPIDNTANAAGTAKCKTIVLITPEGARWIQRKELHGELPTSREPG